MQNNLDTLTPDEPYRPDENPSQHRHESERLRFGTSTRRVWLVQQVLVFQPYPEGHEKRFAQSPLHPLASPTESDQSQEKGCRAQFDLTNRLPGTVGQDLRTDQ